MMPKLDGLRDGKCRPVWPTLTYTALAIWRGLVSRTARALVGSDHVHTFAISTEIVAQGALVDVYKRQAELCFMPQQT